MNIRPVDDRVLVKTAAQATKSKGGIDLVTPIDQSPIVQGVIIAAGNGRRNEDGTIEALDVKVGDIAVFERALSNDVVLEGEEYIVVREANILAVLSK